VGVEGKRVGMVCFSSWPTDPPILEAQDASKYRDTRPSMRRDMLGRLWTRFPKSLLSGVLQVRRILYAGHGPDLHYVQDVHCTDDKQQAPQRPKSSLRSSPVPKPSSSTNARRTG
jgi:hypothetical protein